MAAGRTRSIAALAWCSVWAAIVRYGVSRSVFS